MRVIWILCLVVLSGCVSSTPDGPTTPLDIQVTVDAGQTIDVPRAALRVTFTGVMGDSRCPADALCIQGGDAVVRIDVRSATGEQASYDFHTGNMQPVRHAGLTVALLELSPYPFSSRPISPGEYRATFRITR